MGRSKLLALILLSLTLIAFALLGIEWVHYRLTHAITNAVFVESDTFTKVAYEQVSGRIKKLFKEGGDYVRKGEALAKVEDEEYLLKLGEVR